MPLLLEAFEISSSYDIYADADLYSVDAHISDWSIPGAEVYAVLYEEDITGGDPILFESTLIIMKLLNQIWELG